ncbi:succinylglutamate desuccinylase/aspartoacylase family protein [Halomicroarcula limicola]|uniref:Succinylglutamate desuccinylase/aspartoacylase family protein n=1 Tax=Haloarcula limicola TaxID=1429915 RepID=A0A8J7Y2C3_9EURY|nr:succinylglutamate desuccinylase/aspartoacylase family protein [Halomicroarcula limicola]MBV0922747.1 succinylglutamate desuccinylase/aspartoacylase family protein [Halomicroarcula limicola]
MRVEQLGDGAPEIVVVGGIHGDEPCGPDAIESILADPPSVNRPVKFIVANEEALEAGERYLETDLNRAFPGDPDSALHEERLAAELTEELRGCTVLGLHSTQSYDGMFALVEELSPALRDVLPNLSVDAVVETEAASEGRIFSVAPGAIEVECGYQGSPEAAENAEQVIREFLAATGVTDEKLPARRESLPVFRLGDPIPKAAADQYEVYARNFEEHPAGEPIAAADGEQLVSDEPFHPVLLSAEGYEEVFGYTADHVGALD